MPAATRRTFLYTPALFGPDLFGIAPIARASTGSFDLRAFERPRVVGQANQYLDQQPVTVTAARSTRSAGGLHDYFSEGDYWWPDPKDPEGPYVQRDGMSNPGNFSAHRDALMSLSVQAPALAAAWLLTRERRYSDRAALHLRAWFLAKDTAMNPNLQYAQAIHGRTTGRGIGIIDTLQLVEVARSATVLEASGSLSRDEMRGLRQWFADYLRWMTTSKNGIEERDTKNNHATCWVAQAAEFSLFTGNAALTAECRRRFKTILLPNQMAQNGSFPQELRRTKPYSYSLFNLEVMSGICQSVSTPDDNLWSFALPDGRSMARGLAFMFPFIKDKKTWPYPPDVMYFDQWPLRQQSLLFGGLAFDDTKYIALWKTLNPNPTALEAIRNYPYRQPVLWTPPR